MYKVWYFKPESPSQLEQFLIKQMDDGWELVSMDNGYLVFKEKGL